MPGGTGQSRVTLNLTDGQRQEIRQGTKGVLVDVGGTAHDLGSHNCYVDSAWFYPVFTLTALANDPTLAVTLAGQETREGEPVDHLMITRVVTRRSPSIAALIQHLSSMDLYLDATRCCLPRWTSTNTRTLIRAPTSRLKSALALTKRSAER